MAAVAAMAVEPVPLALAVDAEPATETSDGGIEQLFRLTGKHKPFAGAMWGKTGSTTDLKGDTVANILGAADIEPLKPVVSGQTTAIPRRNVKFEPYLVLEDPQIKPPKLRPAQDLTAVQDKTGIANRLSSADAHDKRRKLGAYLGVTLPPATPPVSAALGRDLRFAPRSTAAQWIAR